MTNFDPVHPEVLYERYRNIYTMAYNGIISLMKKEKMDKLELLYDEGGHPFGSPEFNIDECEVSDGVWCALSLKYTTKDGILTQVRIEKDKFSDTERLSFSGIDPEDPGVVYGDDAVSCNDTILDTYSVVYNLITK